MNRLRIILLILCLLISNNISAQNKGSIDSLEMVIKTSKNDSVIMDAYNKLRRITYYTDPKTSQVYTLKFLETAEKRKDSFHMALANYYLGNTYVVQHDYEEALNQYLKSADYFETQKDSSRLSSVLNGIGVAYEHYGNDTLSLKYYKRSQQINKSVGDLRRSAIALNNIANIYKNRNDLLSAKAYMEEAVEDINSTNETQYMLPIAINLANIYTDLKDFRKSTDLYNELLPKIDTLNEVFSYGAILRGLGNSNMARGNKKEALKYLKHAFFTYSESDFFDDRYNMMPDLIKAYELNRQHASALKLFNEYNTIKDSVFNTEKDKNLTEAIQKYEAVKKDKEIATQNVLLEQNEKAMLKKKNEFRLALLGGSLFLISSIGIWLFYKQKQKLKTKEIEALKIQQELSKLEALIEGEEKERKRIAQDLHDGINGDLSVIKYKITSANNEKLSPNEKEEFNSAVVMLDNAIEQVRNISHNLAPPSLQNFKLIEAIKQYCININEANILKVEFNHFGEFLILNEEIETAIYRIVQELVNNIVKHAKATEALVQINSHDNIINIAVEDNGIGLDTTKNHEGLGLKNIKSRVTFLKGNLKINGDNHGTTVTIDIDLNNL